MCIPWDGKALHGLKQIEAMKLAFAEVYRFVAEPKAMQVTPAQKLDDACLAARSKLIDRKRAQAFGVGQFIWRLGDPADDGYVAASDARRDGQAAA